MKQTWKCPLCGKKYPSPIELHYAPEHLCPKKGRKQLVPYVLVAEPAITEMNGVKQS